MMMRLSRSSSASRTCAGRGGSEGLFIEGGNGSIELLIHSHKSPKPEWLDHPGFVPSLLFPSPRNLLRE